MTSAEHHLPAAPPPAAADAERPYALVVEFADVDSVMHAAEKLRDSDFSLWDVHTPFPVHGLPRAMGLRPTILPWIALAHGLIGAALGLALVWWTNATTFDLPGLPPELQGYQFLASGKPRFSLPANIPIIFELAVLLAAIGTLLGLLGLNKLPQHHNPLFRSRAFQRATSDRFLIVIESQDPKFDPLATPDLLRTFGAVDCERVYAQFVPPVGAGGPASASRHPPDGPGTISAVGAYQDERFPVPWPHRLRRELRLPRPPKWLVVSMVLLFVPAGVLLGLIAYARTHHSPRPRIHLIQDMDIQPRFGPQDSNPVFADRRSARLPVEGAIARGHLEDDPHYHKGYEVVTDAATGQSRIVYFAGLPARLAPEPGDAARLVERGRLQYAISCAACHGPNADGRSSVNAVARRNNEPKWVAAPSLLTAGVRQQADGQIYATIRDGVRSMASYGAQVDTDRRWAIVAYLRDLQARSPGQATGTAPAAAATHASAAEEP